MFIALQRKQFLDVLPRECTTNVPKYKIFAKIWDTASTYTLPPLPPLLSSHLYISIPLPSATIQNPVSVRVATPLGSDNRIHQVRACGRSGAEDGRVAELLPELLGPCSVL